MKKDHNQSLKIGILVCSDPQQERYAGVDRLGEAVMERGHEVQKLYTPRFVFRAKKTGYEVFYEGEPFADFDVLIYRPNFIQEPSLHAYVVRILRESGYRLVNGEANVSATKNKIEQHLLFQEADFPCPEWLIVKSRKYAREAAEQLGFPLIAKLAFGTHGIGVFYVPNQETLQPVVDYLSVRDGNPMIFERFVADAARKDLRVFVVGGEVVAAMEREARADEVRANVAAGGTGKATELSAEEERLVVDTANYFGLEIGGIDLLRTENGPLLLEVNSNPGFKELELATGKDIAGIIIDYAAKI